MQQKTSVIKSDSVRLAGACTIGAGAVPAQAAPAGSSGQPACNAAARIVEQKDGLAVVEVTCSCGRKTQLHCTLAAS